MGGFIMTGPCYQFRVARTRRDTATADIGGIAAGTPAGALEPAAIGALEPAATMTGGRAAFC